MTVTVGDVVRVVEERFPAAWAEGWDRVGLLVGDASASVSKVLVTLDPTRDALARAADAGAQLLFSHHPAFLEPPGAFTALPGAAGVAFEAARTGVALAAAHTNLDRGTTAADALAEVLGLKVVARLETGLQPAALVTVFVPAEQAERVREAMREAGAGRIGEYDGCSFTARGEGRFTPREESSPAFGVTGREEAAEELRVEMVCPAAAAPRVAEAAARVHPYEEPLIVVSEMAMRRGAARMGRLCEADGDTTVERLASRVGGALGVVARIWGERSAKVRTMAVATGSGGSMVPHAIAAGASALVCGEVRYHDALDAASRGVAVIEVGHDATEWPLVPVLARAVRSVGGLGADDVVEDSAATGWWTP